MTIFAGAFSLDPDCKLPDTLCDSLRSFVSRNGADQRCEIHNGPFFLAKVDIGAFGANALLHDDGGSVTAVAGEPLIDSGDGDQSWNRSKDVALLHPLLLAECTAGLQRSSGTFCGVHFNAERGHLSLFVDKVGVRPLYVWVGPQFAVFSTALRILEAVADVPKELDVRGVTEISAFNFALADRTPYSGIRMLRAAEIIRIADGAAVSETYCRWDDLAENPTPPEQLVKKCYEEFVAAIKRRQRGVSVAAAFLSGGLDSRVIVGGLHAAGCDVHTVNYAPDGSQDQVFAKLIADKLGVSYSQLHTNAANVAQGYRKTAVAEWIKDVFSKVNTSGCPPLFWSGDGGSVALGHVYLSRPIFDAMQRGDTGGAIELLKCNVSTRIITRKERAAFAKLPALGVREELQQICCADPGRAFHLFLMFNDQRRHLTQHFEDIDLERIEFQLPFFDGNFLETILRAPSEPFLQHRFYLEWLEEFPNQLSSVAWQAYPGHMPCPLPIPPGLKLQWKTYYDKQMYRQMELASADDGKQMLSAPHFPHHLLSHAALTLATWVTRLGWRNYGYLIRTARFYYRYWAICVASAGCGDVTEIKSNAPADAAGG
jgi:asparagine synthase (glutamine-hydrolysing)